MEHRREVKEEEEIVEKAEESPNEAHKSATFSDPTPQTRDLSVRGRCRAWEKGPAVSASLGAMRALVRKLDMLLLDPPRACSSESVKENMQLLKEDVEEISSCLDTLSQLEDPPQMAKCWMNEVRDLSYNLEDYIDNLHVQAAETSLAADSINTTRSHRKWFSCVRTPKKPTWDEQIVETVSEFRIYIHNAMKRQKMYGLQFFSTLRRTLVPFVHMLPTATPYEETSDIVVNDSMNKFINSLPNDGADQQQLKVVSVLGSSCLGKTTLARVLYKRIGLQFDCRAFVRVSKNPDMKKIFQDMLSQLERQQCPPQYSKEGDLINKIKNYLQGKRYLVIIDDLWSASVWDSINHAFPKVSHGSRIITTTQNEDIAFRCCHYQSEQVFEMKPLDDRHSRKLFFNRLFGSESKCPEQFKNVSNQIIALCGGLPLATIIIASLLASQPVMTEDLLQHIHESLSSLCSANPTSERTRQALNLSFNNLPQYLKTCLLYVSMYQEGYIFCQNDLVKQWMAEGFIDTTKGEDMEEVAKSYLHQLIGRRFIQPIRINYNNEVLSCAVHDVVHDLIAQKSAEDNFIVAIDHSEKNVAHPHKARRLSILFDDARYAKSPAYTIKSHVRSLTFVGLFECMPSITEFKLLRVLNLQLPGYGGCKGLCRDNNTVDLSVISELSRLRYLKIASHLFIKLPDYMGGLHCLETLDIVDAVVLKFGIGVRLPHLLHFYLSLHDERNVDNWIDKLKHLQELRLTFPSAGPSSQEENLLVLRDFISGHDNLKVIVGACDSSDKVIDGTSDATIPWVDMAPPPLLERFEFSPHRSCIFPMIPPWVEKHNNLSILKIAVKELGMMCVGILRGLPALTALSLYVETMPAEKIIFDKPGFSVLKYIKLRFMSGVALLKFEADAMPNVLKLKLVFNAVPQINQYEHGIINIDHMPGLREICVKFVGAATGPEYALVSNHQSNPIINRKSSVCNSFDDKSTNQKLQTYEILKGERDEIVEEERDDHGTESKTPVDQRILRSPVSSSRPHVPDSGLDIQNLQREVKTRWLKPREVLDILRNCELLGIQNRTPQRPPSGSWFLFNRRVHLFFRNDGYVWQKKRNGRSGNEAHEYLKVDNVKALNCYYARAENKPTFMRRIYWMLEPAYEHIVLVHYRDILEGSISVSALNGSPTSNQNGSASRADAHSSPGLTSEIIAPLLNSCSPGSAEEVSSQIPTINTETNDISLFDWRRTLEMQLSLENKERHDVNTDEVLPNHDPIPVHGIQNEELDACINLADVFELGFSEDNHAEGSHPYLDPIDDVLKYSETCWDWEDDQLNPILDPASVTVDENQKFHIHEVSPEWAFCSESAKVSPGAALSIQKNFRCWKKRKEFQKIRKNVIKIQARFRAHRERNKYKELLQSVVILEKIMLRWFRKGVGLRGIGSRMPIEQDEEEDIVKVFRKERVETAVNEAVSRVSAIVGCPVARLDYRRMLEIHQQAKIGHGN